MDLLTNLGIPLPIFYTLIVVYVAYVCFQFLLTQRRERYSKNFKCQQRAVKYDKLDLDSSTACSSPNCVRCHTYRQLQSYAKYKIEQAMDSDYPDELLRIVEAVLNPIPTLTNGEENISEQNPNVLFVQGLRASPFWSESTLLDSDVQLLEDNFDTIRNEFERSLHISETDRLWKYNTTETGAWDVLHLYNQGQKVSEVCKYFPKTDKIIQNLPSFMEGCAFGNATFSVIYCNTLISEHYGPCNVRIRCHLGLQIPNSQHCHLTVANNSKSWDTGKCLLFDDSFLHKAEYSSEDLDAEPRIVFMVDFWHPGLSAEEKNILTELFNVSLL